MSIKAGQLQFYLVVLQPPTAYAEAVFCRVQDGSRSQDDQGGSFDQGYRRGLRHPSGHGLELAPEFFENAENAFSTDQELKEREKQIEELKQERDDEKLRRLMVEGFLSES